MEALRLSGAEILFYAEMHLMPEEVPLTTAEKLVPGTSQMHLRSEPVRLSAAGKLVPAEMHLRPEVHL
jgi:hypothetical protein